MQSLTALQIFLIIDIFVVGALVALALQHAYAHYTHQIPESKKAHAAVQNGHLPPAVRERLLQAAQADFEAVLNRSAEELQHDLKATAAQINKLVEKQSKDVIGDDLDYYRTKLAELQKQAEGEVSVTRSKLVEHEAELQAEMDAHQAELKAKMAEEVEAEKQRLLQQIDTRLADAVASFLIETLQHNVDLGAQSAYLTAMLEEHKADFAREVKG